MMRTLKSLPFGASLLAVAGILLLFAASVSAQEPTPQPEPLPSPAAPQAAQAEPAAPQQAVAPRIFQAAWEIVVDGKAEANGVLELVFQPHGGETTLVKVNVLAKTKKDQIAKDLAKELTFATGADYKVKASGNKVNVKLKNKKSPPFNLGIETQAVNGVSVRVGKG
jgi:outer membrane receptor protein involved in Fe transport